MAYTTINKSTDYFNTLLYTGNDADGNAITGVGHSPDFVWIKQRNSMSHRLYDKIRGVNSAVSSDNNAAENQYAAYGQFESFDSDGFTVGVGTNTNGTQGYGTNQNSQSIVSWNWKANGAGSSNTDGSINTTYTSVNTTAGFSISKYTGTGANATVGHGLGAVPKMIIVKDLNNSNSWYCYHTGIGNTHGLRLNTTDAKDDDATLWNDTTPTSSVFSIGSNTGTNRGSNPMIAYCFAEKTGYSKFGSFLGNGNADGPFIFTGFKPKWFMWKSATSSGGTDNWNLVNSAAQGYNGADAGYLQANNATGEDGFSGNQIDFLSNGMEIKQSSQYHNYNGQTYIYMCFGQSIVGSNNVPCTAR